MKYAHYYPPNSWTAKFAQATGMQNIAERAQTRIILSSIYERIKKGKNPEIARITALYIAVQRALENCHSENVNKAVWHMIKNDGLDLEELLTNSWCKSSESVISEYQVVCKLLAQTDPSLVDLINLDSAAESYNQKHCTYAHR